MEGEKEKVEIGKETEKRSYKDINRWLNVGPVSVTSSKDKSGKVRLEAHTAKLNQ